MLDLYTLAFPVEFVVEKNKIYFCFIFFRFSISLSSARFTSSSDLVPVQTTFPFENSRNVAFCSGSL